ncbi:putative dehydrogenase [Rhizobium mesoamericanum]|uniref:Gfo/Idh/MocA family oxidoreductase n=1 Tax=Rhizobium mesoamericanum TaxID=1079800 RepID=UPI0027896821|nr:Gfo/Idh/MocA family oxidoreductase [Rhizobium mesoamericanum]MDQ0561291.1 putative dehydrogenase [Rhizobium mesoamericanum]
MQELSQGRINIAVVGAGLIGRRHIEDVLSEPRAALAAIIDPAESARDWALAEGLPGFASLSGVFAESRPDGVIDAIKQSVRTAQTIALERSRP